MVDFSYASGTRYFHGIGIRINDDFVAGTLSDGDNDNRFETGDSVTETLVGAVTFDDVAMTYVGTVDIGGTICPVFEDTPNTQYYWVFEPQGSPAAFSLPSNLPSINTGDDFVFCFGAGTRIATPSGDRAVETLEIGDEILTANGHAVAVKWLGRQTMLPAFASARLDPILIEAGALGRGLPTRDLLVTADHGMILDGLVVNAGVLVNGHSIRALSPAELPRQMTYYHIETEAHDVILAEGAAAETFIDYAARKSFDNYAEYEALYGAERLLPEMPLPRISSARLLPQVLKERLGIVGERVGLKRTA